jgi:hypothetical protein
MTQLATRSPVDVYVIATLGDLDRVVAEVVLPEPKVRGDEMRATRVIACALETLAGLAIGCAVGAVADAVRRTFGVTPVVTADVAPPPRAPHWMDEERMKTSVAGLKHELRRRIGRGHREAIAMIAPFEGQIGAGESSAFGRMLGLLARDELVAERFAPQVQAGWRCAVAAIEGRSIPAIDPLWQRWAQRFRGDRPVVTPTSSELAAAGVIMQIG